MMLDHPASIASESVVGVVNQFLATRSIAAPIEVDQDLQEAGLTSLDIVNLMLTIEAAFDLTISGADLVPANFRSIATIEALISNLLGRN